MKSPKIKLIPVLVVLCSTASTYGVLTPTSGLITNSTTPSVMSSNTSSLITANPVPTVTPVITPPVTPTPITPTPITPVISTTSPATPIPTPTVVTPAVTTTPTPTLNVSPNETANSKDSSSGTVIPTSVIGTSYTLTIDNNTLDNLKKAKLLDGTATNVTLTVGQKFIINTPPNTKIIPKSEHLNSRKKSASLSSTAITVDPSSTDTSTIYVANRVLAPEEPYPIIYQPAGSSVFNTIARFTVTEATKK